MSFSIFPLHARHMSLNSSKTFATIFCFNEFETRFLKRNRAGRDIRADQGKGARSNPQK